MTEPQHQPAAAEVHPQQPEQQLRQRQSEPQLLQVPPAATSRHQKRHSEFNLTGLTGIGDESDVDEPVTCHRADVHEHLDHVMADADIPMGVEQLANCLLTDGPWFRDFLQRRSTFGMEAGDFEDESGGDGGGPARRPGVRRSVRYWLRINYAIGPKQTLVEETQTYVWCEPGKLHIVDCEVHNRDIPYGTSFHTLNRMCLTSLASGRSHLTITSRTVFTRHVFLAKSFIESNVREGSKTYFRLMVDTLLDPNAGKLPINDEEGSGAVRSRTSAGASSGGASQSASSSLKIPLSTSSPKSPSTSAGATLPRRRTSANSASAAAAASATASAGRRAARARSGRSRGDQRLLLLCLLLASVLMLGCLFSLHLRFQSLDSSLARLKSDEYSRSACGNSNFFTSGGGGSGGSPFTREQLDIWRRALDETMGSLDGLLFELRRLATAAAATSASNRGGGSVCAPPRS